MRKFCCACWAGSVAHAGTVEGGLEVMRGFLTQAGIASDQYVFYDGSGLSRQNLVTPHAIVQFCATHQHSRGARLTNRACRWPGVDGSLSERLEGSRLEKRVLAKTGSLGGVKTLSGYATTDSGQTIAFSILSNNLNVPAKRVTDTIDGIVDAIVEASPGHGDELSGNRESFVQHTSRGACDLAGWIKGNLNLRRGS